MQNERPYVLTIAGFDPCSGAGLTADIKTFEQLKVYGLALCSGLTLQTEDQFFSIEWRNDETVKTELETLLKKYPVAAVKFGIVPSVNFIKKMVKVIKNINPNTFIIIDPIWKSSTGFTFNESDISQDISFLEQVDLITPNTKEMEFIANGKNQIDAINEIRNHCDILLKGGHNETKTGVDTLFQKNNSIELHPDKTKLHAKHGSGCVLSSAITSYLALGNNMETSCRKGKAYIENFLNSNESLLGYHVA